jgi:hypothetical protein
MQKNDKKLKLSINEWIVFIILTCALTRGIIEMMGIPTIIPKSIMEFLILLLFVKASCLRHIAGRRRVRIIGLLSMACLLCICMLSFAMKEQPVLKFLFFMRNIFIYYLLFVALLKLNLSENGIKKLNKYLMFLFLIQIPIGIAKYMFYGICEGGPVGTIGLSSGNYSTTLPLFVIALLFSFYLFKKKKLYILLIFGFVVFGLIGSKRALAFYVPPLLFFLYRLYAVELEVPGKNVNRASLVIHVRTLVLIALISCLGIYIAGRTLISLNPDSKVWGRFDPHFIMDMTTDYLTMETEEGYTFGRINSTFESLKVLKNAGPLTVLLGFGPGLLTESSLTGTDMVDITTLKFGIYRGQTGFVWLVLQIGILGTTFFLLLYFQLFKAVFLIYRQTSDPNWKPVILGFLGVTFVFVLDFLTYSPSTMFLGVLTPVYFYIAAICLKVKTFPVTSQRYPDGLKA